MIELWVIRHGQTLDNIQKMLAGHQPGQLTNLGIRQAKKTGECLVNEQFDYAYVSDLARTKATFQNIQSQMKYKIPENKVTFTSLMREKGGGEYEGKPLETFRKAASDQKIPLRQFKGKGGECWNDVYQRAEKFLLSLAINHLQINSKKSDQQQQKVQQPLNDQGEEQKINNDGIQNEEQLQQQQNQEKITKIMGVSHGGFIMEIHNVIEHHYQQKEPNLNNVAKNCSIHKIQISLSNKYKLDEIHAIGFQDLIINVIDRNNDAHCKDLK